jgi:hypothetical protein
MARPYRFRKSVNVTEVSKKFSLYNNKSSKGIDVIQESPRNEIKTSSGFKLIENERKSHSDVDHSSDWTTIRKLVSCVFF